MLYARPGMGTREFIVLFLVALCGHVSGLTLPLMEPDAALYASIAKRMAESGDYLQLFARGTDWLDKPHLPLWLTALSFEVFGVHAPAYRLPGLIVFFVGVVYTYLFALRCWSRDVARLAVLVLMTAQHVVMSNVDVRAEPFLLGFIMGAVYHGIRASEDGARSALHVIPASFLAACAMMSKGPFVLIVIAGALVLPWLVQRDWWQLGRARWYVGVVLVALFILPELYALHVQFDQHPEKVVFGRQGVSGVRFFFWDSQFGRFLGTGPIRSTGDVFFYAHTLLWAFLPWSVLLCVALAWLVWAALKNRGVAREVHSLGATLPALVVFSLSDFQLPHYTNILFPFFAVMVAAWSVAQGGRWPFVLKALQGAIMVLSLVASVGLLVLVRPETSIWIPAAVGLATVALLVWVHRRMDGPNALMGGVVVAAMAMNVILNAAILPTVLSHQSGLRVAEIVNASPGGQAGMYVLNSYAFEFYSERPVERWSLEELEAVASREPVLLYMPEGRLTQIREAGLEIRPIERLDHFHVARPTLKFLNASTRGEVLEKRLLAEVRAPVAPPCPVCSAQNQQER